VAETQTFDGGGEETPKTPHQLSKGPCNHRAYANEEEVVVVERRMLHFAAQSVDSTVDHGELGSCIGKRKKKKEEKKEPNFYYKLTTAGNYQRRGDWGGQQSSEKRPEPRGHSDKVLKQL